MTTSQRDELVSLLWGARFPTGGAGDYIRLDANAAHAITTALLDAGLGRPEILGYLVVDAAGNLAGEDTYEDREGAQGDVDAWNDAAFGPVPPGGYRVAGIVAASNG